VTDDKGIERVRPAKTGKGQSRPESVGREARREARRKERNGRKEKKETEQKAEGSKRRR
jgi:hypothetical protein